MSKNVNNKENRPAGTFHKMIDLKVQTGHAPDAVITMPSGAASATAAGAPPAAGAQWNMISMSDQKDGKRHNSSFDANSRRFSLFSKSSFATQSSFLFGTRSFNRSFSNGKQPLPKVNITNIFKQKAYLYLDEALAHTFDDLLDKGYELVANRKEERDVMKEHQIAMETEALALEKEIIPLINQAAQKQDTIQAQLELKARYEDEIRVMQRELNDLTSSINDRLREIEENHNSLTSQIKNLELFNNEVRTSITINKAQHRQQMSQLEAQQKKLYQENVKRVEVLTERKRLFDDKK